MTIAVAAIFASIGWLYQKAWEKRNKKEEVYTEILLSLDAFRQNPDRDKIEKAVKSLRKLYVVAPNEVVKASQGFVSFFASENRAGKDPVKDLTSLVRAMRNDLSIWRYFRPSKTDGDIPESLIFLAYNDQNQGQLPDQSPAR
ncbi:MAG: hypothetical protein ACR2RF_19565 [Geminicoccaceae bacterium]